MLNMRFKMRGDFNDVLHQQGNDLILITYNKKKYNGFILTFLMKNKK